MSDLPVAQHVAAQIRSIRNERGWPARRLAEECASAGMPSLSRSAIAKIELGIRKSVTADELAVLAAVLEVTPDSLMTPAMVGQVASGLSQPGPAAGNPAPSMPVEASPLFYLSHAHSGDPQITRFFDDLSENVARLVARRAGVDPGFMDRSASPGGHWTNEALYSLGACQVFVALLSGPYYASERCGMEWHAFSQRKVARSEKIGPLSGIVPVTWTPVPDEHTPVVIQKIQRFSPGSLLDLDVEEEYEQVGVSGLMWLMRDVSYRTVVWSLAKYIAHVYHTYLVEPRTYLVEPWTFEPGELSNSFLE
jgi:hypothetical protein